MGHSESTTLQSPPDASGGKNSIQAIGSAVTYLSRYTLLAITGLATGENEDDGQGYEPEKIGLAKLESGIEWFFDTNKTLPELESWYAGMQENIARLTRLEQDKIEITYKNVVAEMKSDSESKLTVDL